MQRNLHLQNGTHIVFKQKAFHKISMFQSTKQVSREQINNLIMNTCSKHNVIKLKSIMTVRLPTCFKTENNSKQFFNNGISNRNMRLLSSSKKT
jgi:hypothetical protein